MSAKAVSSKAGSLKKEGKAPSNKDKPLKKDNAKQVLATENKNEWLHDASLEVPVPVDASYVTGQRELEFSVGMRQQDDEGLIRAELRARALVHAAGQVLVLVEASYVARVNQKEMRPDLPQYLYTKLKPHLDALFAVSGHTPPLPESLENAAE